MPIIASRLGDRARRASKVAVGAEKFHGGAREIGRAVIAACVDAVNAAGVRVAVEADDDAGDVGRGKSREDRGFVRGAVPAIR